MHRRGAIVPQRAMNFSGQKQGALLEICVPLLLSNHCLSPAAQREPQESPESVQTFMGPEKEVGGEMGWLG